MADNTQLNQPTTSGDVIATDDIGGIKHQRVKVEWGPDNTANEVDDASGKRLPVKVAEALPAGTSNIGDVDVLTVPAPLSTTGGGTEATALRVTLASDSTGLVSVDDNGGSLTVDGTVSVSGTVTVQGTESKVDDAAFTPATDRVLPIGAMFDDASPDAVDEGDVGIPRMTSLRAVHVNLRDNSGNELAIGGGTQYDEDTPHVTGDKVNMAGVVQQSADAALSGDGDRSLLQVDSTGYLKVNVKAGGGGGTQYDQGTATTDTDKVTMAGAVRRDTAAVATGVIDGDRLVLSTDSVGRLRVTAADTTQPVSGTVSANLNAGSNNIGDVDVLTLPAIPAGNNNIGDVDIASAPTGSSAIQVQGTAAADVAVVGNPVLVGGRSSAAAPTDVTADGEAVSAWRLRNGAAATVITAAGALVGGDATNGLDVDVTRLPALAAGTNNIGDVDVLTLPGITGNVAHDTGISGNPVRIGQRARTSDITAVANDDVADVISDILGRQVVLPYSIPENAQAGNPAAITTTTPTSVIAAPGAGVRLYITSCIVSNSHASVGTLVQLTDGSGGTVLAQGFCAIAGGGFAVSFPTPLRLTANTALFAVCGTTGANVYVSAQGYKAAA